MCHVKNSVFERLSGEGQTRYWKDSMKLTVKECTAIQLVYLVYVDAQPTHAANVGSFHSHIAGDFYTKVGGKPNHWQYKSIANLRDP